MSFNGTVRCGYCYVTGHNARKCPAKIARVKESYEQALRRLDHAETSWDKEYWADQTSRRREEYIRYTKIDLATGNKVTNKAAKALRMKKVRCSYCLTRGHTRRVCQNLKNDYTIFKTRTAAARSRWHATLVEKQAGRGSLVITGAWGYDSAGEWGFRKTSSLLSGYSVKNVHAHTNFQACVSLETIPLSGFQGREVYRSENWMALAAVTTAPGESSSHIAFSPAGTVPALEDIPGIDEVPPLKQVFPTGCQRSGHYADGRFSKTFGSGLPTDAYNAPAGT